MKGYNFEGYRRITHQYEPGWEELDEHKYIGEFRLLNRRHTPPTAHEMKFGSRGTDLLTIRAPRGVSSDDVIAVLMAEFTTACRCERDCCGCVFMVARTPRHVRRRNWIVPVERKLNV